MGIDKNYQPAISSSLFKNIKEVEQCFLGNLLIDNIVQREMMYGLKEEDFEMETHALIFQAIKEVYEEGLLINLETVADKLRYVTKPDREPWVSYLTYLAEIALPVPDLALKEIKHNAQLRRIGKAAFKLYQATNKDDGDAIQELFDELSDLNSITIQTLDRLKPISAKDLPDEEPQESLWGGLIYPGCITQIPAEPGIGKTTLAYNIACHGALGGSFLGISFSKTIKTLYVDSETPLWLRKEKLEAICGECPKDFHYLDGLNLSRDISELINLCKKEKYDLIVLDTQSKVLNMEDENSNSEANRAATHLTRLARETGVAVLLIHHTRKGDSGNDVYSGRGASAMAAAVDIVANLKLKESDLLELNIAKNRVPGLLDSISMKKVGGDKFEHVDYETDTELHQIRTAIKEISLHGDIVNQKALVNHFKGKIAEKRLRTLLKRGAGKLWKSKPGQRKETIYTDIEEVKEEADLQNGKTAIHSNGSFAVLDIDDDIQDLKPPPEDLF